MQNASILSNKKGKRKVLHKNCYCYAGLEQIHKCSHGNASVPRNVKSPMMSLVDLPA